MKATEFVKKHGWGETQRIVRDYTSHTHVTSDARMFINEHACMDEIKRQLVGLVEISELKSLVKSHEWVELCGGLEDARVLAVVHNDTDLFKAIADVEACQ